MWGKARKLLTLAIGVSAGSTFLCADRSAADVTIDGSGTDSLTSIIDAANDVTISTGDLTIQAGPPDDGVPCDTDGIYCDVELPGDADLDNPDFDDQQYIRSLPPLDYQPQASESYTEFPGAGNGPDGTSATLAAGLTEVRCLIEYQDFPECANKPPADCKGNCTLNGLGACVGYFKFFAVNALAPTIRRQCTSITYFSDDADVLDLCRKYTSMPLS
jgi:hypothetical protein